jgi:hypothetical protein
MQRDLLEGIIIFGKVRKEVGKIFGHKGLKNAESHMVISYVSMWMYLRI